MSRPLRVLIGADTYPPDINGAARFTARLAAGLAGRGHEVHVVAPSDTGPASSPIPVDGVASVHRLRSHRIPGQDRMRASFFGAAATGARQVLAAVRPDVVHVQSHFQIGRGLLAAAARDRSPSVATNHFMPENVLRHARVPRALVGPVARWAWRDLGRVYAAADVVTAPTPRAVDLLVTRAGRPARAVSCGIDLARFGNTADVGPDPVPTVLFVGRLEQERRVGDLIRAFAAVPGDARLEIVGDGSCRSDWTALARDLGQAERVRFRGTVDDDELIAAYRGCAVFCMPSIAELQSLATLEAMAAGRPVVAADAVALPHLVRHAHNGMLVPPGDIPALTVALRSLLADPATRARMGGGEPGDRRSARSRRHAGRGRGHLRGHSPWRVPTGGSAPMRSGFALAVLTVAVGAGTLNTLIAFAGQALGADPDLVPGLTPPAYLTFTVIGTILGALGWSIVRSRATDPARVLSWLVPLVMLVSWVPDALIAVSVDLVGGMALGVMHLAVLAVALPAFRYFLPLPIAPRPSPV